MNILPYKNYDAGAEFDEDRKVWYCKILFIKDFVSFEVDSAAEIQVNFEAAVDDYLDTCKELGKAPEQPNRPRLTRAASA